MAHQISYANGRHEMAYTGATPWHGLGAVVGSHQRAPEMLLSAGLQWTVSPHDLFATSAPSLTAVPPVPVPGYRAVLRDDTHAVLGVVSDRYRPVQNHQAADVMDALIDGGATVEVAGALGHGERCWMLAKVPGSFEVTRGDAVDPYVLVAWGHTGKHALIAKLTPVRVVCHNTLTRALGGQWSASADVSIRHSANAKVRVAEAQAALGLVAKQVAETVDVYRTLAATPLSDPAAADYFARVFPAPVAGDGYEEATARWTTRQAHLAELYQAGRGADMARGTAWGAYNAVTEYLDHVYPVLASGQTSAARQQSVLFGGQGAVKHSALAAALAG